MGDGYGGCGIGERGGGECGVGECGTREMHQFDALEGAVPYHVCVQHQRAHEKFSDGRQEGEDVSGDLQCPILALT